MLDVTRQLRVKKSSGVVAGGIDNPELRQRHEYAGVEDSVEGEESDEAVEEFMDLTWAMANLYYMGLT